MGLRSIETRREPQTPDKSTMATTNHPPDRDPAAASPELLQPWAGECYHSLPTCRHLMHIG